MTANVINRICLLLGKEEEGGDGIIFHYAGRAVGIILANTGLDSLPESLVGAAADLAVALIGESPAGGELGTLPGSGYSIKVGDVQFSRDGESGGLSEFPGGPLSDELAGERRMRTL